MRSIHKRAAAIAAAVAVLLLSVLSSGALAEVPSYTDPMGLTQYADEIIGTSYGIWSSEQNFNEVLKDFAWRPQYYDANPDWDGFYTFKWTKGDSWSDKIDNYVFGQNWLNSSGQFSIQGGKIYAIADHGGDNIKVMSLTFIAPKDGTYKVYSNQDIGLMYPKYFPGGAEYNNGQYVSESSVVKFGFAIHKVGADSDMDTYDPAGSTRIWPTDANYAYLTKETQSMAFPTLETVELKAGEKLRFVFDTTETSGLDNWLIAASMYPMVENVTNTPPTAEDGENACTVGKTTSGQLVGADEDAGDTLTYTLKTDGTKGTAVVNADGSYTYTASNTAEGTDTFVYTVTDSRGASADGTVTITFVANQKPAAANTTFSVLENNTVEGALELSDGDGDTVTASLKNDGANGKATVNADGTFSYTPNTDYAGEDTFVVALTDGVETMDVTVTVTVNDNVAPVVEDVTVNGGKDAAQTITLKGEDANGTALTFAVATQPANGTVTVEGNVATYTPNSGFIGFDSFTYTANDGVNTSEAAEVTVAVLEEGIDSVTTMKDAIIECGDDVDFDKAFDFSEYAYDLPWQFHYRIDGITTDFEDESITEFYTAIAAKIFDWGGWSIGDGNTYPQNTIQNQSGKIVHCLNSGSIADAQNPIAALAFVAPADGTYYFTGSEASNLFGIWPGQATDNGIRIWIEANDGTVVWPESGEALTLNRTNDTVELPALTVAMKQGTALRFCMSGTTANDWNNNVYLAPVAYNLGAYDADLDPVKPVVDDGNDGEDDNQDGNEDDNQGGNQDDTQGGTEGDGDDNTNPDTGRVAPLAALAVTLGGAVTALALLRKRGK